MKFTSALLALAATTLLAAQNQPTEQTAEISGRIIDSATKLPLSGVRVVLTRWTNGVAADKAAIDKAEPQSGSLDLKNPMFAMLTGVDGRYSFQVAARVWFQLYTRIEGYVPWGGRMIRAKPGENHKVEDIAIDQLGSISGRVIDAETEKPIPGLLVRAKYWAINGGCRELDGEGEPGLTNHDGVYELKTLPPRDFVLEIRPAQGDHFEPAGTSQEFRDHAQPSYLRSYFPGVEHRDQAQTVTLTPGGNLDHVDIKLTRRRGAAIRGCIHSDLDGEVVGPATLELDSNESEGLGTSFAVISKKEARSGDCFRLEGVSPGRYVLTATNRKEGTEAARVAFAFLDLEDQRIDNLVLEMRRPAAVPGKLIFPVNMQTAEATRGQVEVSLEALGREGGKQERAPVLVASSGVFTLPAVFEGQYQVFMGGLPGVGVSEVRYNGHRSGRSTFSYQPGAPEQHLELVLAPATASLQVRIEDGAKSAGWELALLMEPLDSPDDPGLEASNSFADDEGRAGFTGLLAGKYRIAAFPPNVPWRTDPILLGQLTSGQTVELSEGASVSVEVKRASVR